MRPVYFLTFALMLIACKPDGGQAPRYSIEQFMNTTTVFGCAFSRDDKSVLYSSDASGIFNVYQMPLRGGMPEQLTFSDSSANFSISYFPRDNRVLFISDRDGDEIWNIFVRETDGEIVNLTPSLKARSTFLHWQEDGKGFFYQSNARDPRFMDVYRMDTESYQSQMVFENQFGYEPEFVSRDERYLAMVQFSTTANSDIYLFDLRDQKLEKISDHRGEILFKPLAFNHLSTALYYLTNEESEFTYLKKMDLGSGRSEIVEKTNWDIMFGAISHHGRYRALGVNSDGQTQIRLYDQKLEQRIELPDFPQGEISKVTFSRDEEYMGFYVNGSRAPNDLYIYDLGSGEYWQRTASMNPEIMAEHLVDGRVVRFKSFDDLEIPAIYYEPQGIAEGEKVPGLVWVHGGPGGQSRLGYHPLIQYLVNHRYAVLAVNNRGSSGYGKTFYQLDDHRHGKDDLADCVAGKEFLIASGVVDPDNIAIAGPSYGGYLALAALAFRPNEFTAGINIFGVSNWQRTLESIPPYWEAIRNALYREIGNPETEADYLRGISPLFHADKIRRPLMVLQGANDTRVLQVESDEIVEAVRGNNVPVEYLVFDDEGHGFRKKENRIRGYRAIHQFLDQHLKSN